MDYYKIFYCCAILLGIVAGCESYNTTNQGPECLSMADCNPGKTCGEMIPCEGKQCKSDLSVDVPCNKACAKDEDCSSGMHCDYLPTNEGVCTLNGLCGAAGDCRGLEEMECLGSFECVDGKCKYYCLSEDSCGQDSECMLADKGCCCGSDPEDFVAILKDRMSDWTNRPECVGEDCPLSACTMPPGILPVCKDGYCHVQKDEEYLCTSDVQCTRVPADCCNCINGGLETAVLESKKQEYLADIQKTCSMIDPACLDFNACTERPAVCHAGRCMLQGQWCDCAGGMDDWDPVCASSAGNSVTYPSHCVGQCLGLDISYNGRCDCMMDCFVPDPVCASNSQTYYCGPAEAECNGQQVRYRGECSQRCDMCLELDRMPIFVCGEDFRDWSDVCFADCHEQSWWHLGRCLDGEGSQCGTVTGIPCPSEETICMVDMADGSGRCVKPGSCLETVNCAAQDLSHDECVGSWECTSNHECNWNCD